jgi:hypothetical protein
LTGRTQVVNIGTSNSDRRDVKFEIPQGSVLEPLLFLVFINDIFELPLKGRLQLYADDAVLSYQHCRLDTMFADMHDLDFRNGFLTINLLMLRRLNILFLGTQGLPHLFFVIGFSIR